MRHALLTFLLFRHASDRSAARSLLFAGVLAAGGLAPTLVVVAAYAWIGHLDAFLQANVSANVAYAAMIPQAVAVFAGLRDGLRPLVPLLLVFAACLAVVLRQPALHQPALHQTSPLQTSPLQNGVDRHLMLWLAIWLAAAALDVCSPIKFWPHYFLALTPPLCIAVPIFLTLPLRIRPLAARPIWIAIAVAGLLVPPGHAALADIATAARRNRLDIPRLLAGDIERLGASGGLYVYDYQPIIYLLAGIEPPTKYVFPAELSGFAGSSGANPLAEFERIMSLHPRFVILSDPPLVPLPDAVERKMSQALLSYRRLVEYTDPNDKNRRVTLLVRLR